MTAKEDIDAPITLVNLQELNRDVNSNIVYRENIANNWQTPTETRKNGYGNCMDFAIMKYYRLHRQLGIPIDDMFIVIGNYRFPGGNTEVHAVVQVKIREGIYILDIHHSNHDSDKPIRAREYYKTKMPEVAYGINHHEWTRKPFE